MSRLLLTDDDLYRHFLRLRMGDDGDRWFGLFRIWRSQMRASLAVEAIQESRRPGAEREHDHELEHMPVRDCPKCEALWGTDPEQGRDELIGSYVTSEIATGLSKAFGIGHRSLLDRLRKR